MLRFTVSLTGFTTFAAGAVVVGSGCGTGLAAGALEAALGAGTVRSGTDTRGAFLMACNLRQVSSHLF